MSCDSAFVFCKASPAAWGSALLVVAALKWGACTPLETDKEIAERDLKLHNGGWWEGAGGSLSDRFALSLAFPEACPAGQGQGVGWVCCHQ